MKAAIIGTGFIGQKHLEAQLLCNIRDICICDSNYERAKKTAASCGGRAYTDHMEMIKKERPDFIAVCTPTPTHYDIVMDAIDEGIPVLCEKPFCSTPMQADMILKKAEDKNVMLMVAHCLRFARQYAYLGKCISDGRFGKLLSLNLYRHSTEPKWSLNGWMGDLKISGGAVVDLHIHETDIVVFLFGAPSYVTTTGDYKQCATIYHYGRSGPAISAQSSWRGVSTYPFTCGYDAEFEKAAVICEGDNVRVYTEEGCDENVLKKEDFPYYFEEKDPYVCEVRYFTDCLKEGKTPYCDPYDSVLSLKTVHAELESLLRGKKIKIM